MIPADYVIVNGQVYNGIDTIPQEHTIAVRGDQIIYVGPSQGIRFDGARVINAADKIVCPGFIDPHTHADRELKEADKADNLPFLMQGVTTVVVGSDGDSYFPSSKFKTLYEEHGIGTNAIMMVGHGRVRSLIVGRSNRAATIEEIQKMQRAVEIEMEAGAFGLSSGLFYAPGSYANTEEVIALARVVAKKGGVYESHLRDEGSYTIGLQAAVAEAIEIGREAEIPVQIAHIKCLGADVWGQSKTIVDMVNVARAEGIQVTANQYPYDASATGLQAAVVPRWAESGGTDSLRQRYEDPELRERILADTRANITRRGGPDKLLLVMVEDSAFLGKTVLEVAQDLQLPPEEAVFEILATGTVRIASFNMQPSDIHQFMQQPWVVTGSDGNTGHPRKYGSFPRKYRKYVVEDKVINLAHFINNSSARTARFFGIPERGELREGYYADILVIDPEYYRDEATYTDAFEYAKGLKYCFLNGKLVVDNGAYRGVRHGRV
ncbi:MAG: amidohydrolase family protein, partial [Bacteroidota bacterium]